jgi:hypothetical protein
LCAVFFAASRSPPAAILIAKNKNFQGTANMTPRTIKAAAVVAMMAIAGFWYWSPFLAARPLFGIDDEA